MKGKLLFLSGIVLVASCKNVPEKSASLGSGVILENMDTTVRPGDNFANYVNGVWIKKTAIPPDKANYGVGSMINDKAQEDVKAIIEESSGGNFQKGSDEQKVGDFYESYMNTKVRDSIGLAPLQEELKKVQAITSKKELTSFFAHAYRNEYGVPMGLGVIEDFKDPKKYMLYTWQGGLGLPDREYYLLEDEKSKAIREKYVAHVQKMLELSGIDKAAEKAKTVMAFETQLASKQMKKEDTRNIVALYNKFATKDLNTLIKDFDWNQLLSESGVKNIDTITICQV